MLGIIYMYIFLYCKDKLHNSDFWEVIKKYENN